MKILDLAEKFNLIRVKKFSYNTKSDGSGLRGLQNFIKEKCYKYGLLQEDVYNIILATDEAFTNIMKHGYKYEVGDVFIDIEFRAFFRFLRIEIVLKDKTIGFDWESIPAPDLENYMKSQRKGGFGIYLIKNLVDKISSRKDDIYNILTLTKSIRRPILFGIGLKWPSIIILTICLISTGAFWFFQTEQEKTFEKGIFNQIESSISDIGNTSKISILEKNYEYLSILIKSCEIKNDYLKEIFIVNNENIIVADTDINKFLTVYKDPELLLFLEKTGFHYYILDNNQLLLKYIILQSENELGVIYSVVDFKMIKIQVKELHQTNLRNFIIFLIGIGFTAIILVVYFFVAPVKKLFDGVMEIESGKLSRPHTMRGKDEFSQIKRIFNEFAMRFEETRNTLTDAQRDLLDHELLKKEMQVAQSIQQTLLPKIFPDLDEFEINAFYKSAKEVGGDYYDFIPISKNKLGIIVADVSGKGVPGSMIMTMIRTAVRLIAPRSHSAKEVMIKLNNIIQNDLNRGMFITIYFVILNTKTHELQFSSAGHTPMLLHRGETGEVYSLNPKGIPIGLKLMETDFFLKSIKSETIKLKKDDLIIIYTDGITEAMNAKFEQYSQKRFLKIIKNSNKKELGKFLEILERSLSDFIGDQPQSDDITLVLIKDLGQSQGIYEKRFEKINFLPFELIEKVLDVIKATPDFGIKRIMKKLNEMEIEIDEKILLKELKRLNLTNKEKRRIYSKYMKK